MLCYSHVHAVASTVQVYRTRTCSVASWGSETLGNLDNLGLLESMLVERLIRLLKVFIISKFSFKITTSLSKQCLLNVFICFLSSPNRMMHNHPEIMQQK